MDASVVASDGLRLAYHRDDFTKPWKKAQTIVLIHGACGSHRRFYARVPRLLSPEQYEVMRRHGTEQPGSCALLLEKRSGKFTCAGCDSRLFEGRRKFESGTGWPSFNDPFPGAIETDTDPAHHMVRTEVHCATCGSHLGHVFDDGPPPTHLRYCINGVAMNLIPD